MQVIETETFNRNKAGIQEKRTNEMEIKKWKLKQKI
jgi:hypothetical protein